MDWFRQHLDWLYNEKDQPEDIFPWRKMDPHNPNMKCVDAIVSIYVRHITLVAPVLNRLFGAELPESALPFPKEILLNALSITANNHALYKNKLGFDSCKEVAAGLAWYINDAEALSNATKFFPDPRVRRELMQSLQESFLRHESDFIRSINCGYLGDKATGIYHVPFCTHALQIKQEDEVWDNDIMTFKKQQMSPCDVCKPPK
jgi:hypothetical protein